MQPLQHAEYRFGDEGERTVIDSEFKVRGHCGQFVLQLRAHVQLGGEGRGRTGRNRGHGGDHAQYITTAAEGLAVNLLDLILWRSPRGEKIVLDHRGPAAFYLLLELALVHVVERDLLIFVVLARDHAAGVRIDEGGLTLDATALELTIETPFPFLRALIAERLRDIDDISATVEGVDLGERPHILK